MLKHVLFTDGFTRDLKTQVLAATPNSSLGRILLRIDERLSSTVFSVANCCACKHLRRHQLQDRHNTHRSSYGRKLTTFLNSSTVPENPLVLFTAVSDRRGQKQVNNMLTERDLTIVPEKLD